MQIKYELDEGAYTPMRAHDADAGFDLACKEDQVLEPNVANTIDTGVHVLIPEGFVGLLCPRSSFNVKGIGTPIGVVDAGYTGSIRVVLEPFNVTKIFKGNRIAQLVILPLPNIKMIEGKVIGVDTHRGDGGFGSTGE
nr:MAG TPA: dUTPase [Caudoviricetes sp.]